MKRQIPRIMIAAAGSGSGKTVITCALLSILKDRGMNPVSFKCGPDYIDPMFHRSVLGIDSHNLDTYLAGPDGVASVFEDAVSRCGYGFAVIEGVMGIYDGMTPGSLNGSCYEIAGITKTPIVLVADASGVGQTVVSLIKGVLADDRDHLVKGIILNRMSDAFYEKLLPYLREELAKIRDDVEVLGHIPKSDEFVLESRHLGLKLPGEIDGIRERIARAAKIMETGCRTDDVIDIASGAAKAVPEKTRNDGLKHGGAEKCFRENLVEASALDEVSHESSVSYVGTGARARFRRNCFDSDRNLISLIIT